MDEFQPLDLNAPLISVRRIRLSVPSSGPVGEPGLVPFTWEHKPGRPKIPPAGEPVPFPRRLDDGDEFSDADADTLGSPEGTPERSRSFRKDQEVLELMMGRFLPAAKAMATGPLRTASRKESGRDGNYGRRRKPIPLPYQNQPDFAKKNLSSDREDDDDYFDDYGALCGFVPRFWLKGSFLQLNPVPAIRRGGALEQDEVEHCWEAVYTHKLGRENLIMREDGSRLTSESNRLTCWSDSQSPGGSSSPYFRSTGGRESPLRDENSRGFSGVLKREVKGWKSGSFDSDERPGERPCHGKSASVDRTLYVDSVQLVDPPSLGSSLAIGSVYKDFEVIAEDSHIVEEKHLVKPELCQIVEPDLSVGSVRTPFGEVNGSGLGKINGSKDSSLTSENDDKEKSDTSLALALLPPPLPNSPSESWLRRTLPSISTKNAQSLLGIQVQHKRQASRTALSDLKWITDVKSSKSHNRQMRPAEAEKECALQQCETEDVK